MTRATIEKKEGFTLLPLNSKGELIENKFYMKSPRNLVIVKYPKSGSTLSLGNVPKILIADTERSTINFPISNAVDLLANEKEGEFTKTNNFGYIPTSIFDLVLELSKANKMDKYWEIFNKLGSSPVSEKDDLHIELLKHINTIPFPIVAIDTITALVDISNSAALYEYNSGKSPEKQKANIKRADEYGGVMYTRRKFNEIKRFIEKHGAPFIQYHGHVSQRKKILKKGDDEISAVDIALDGIMSTIFTSQADAVCTFVRNDEGCFMDFSKKEESDLGSRCLHLSNRNVKIADIQTDENLNKGIMPKTYWGEIYPEILIFQENNKNKK